MDDQIKKAFPWLAQSYLNSSARYRKTEQFLLTLSELKWYQLYKMKRMIRDHFMEIYNTYERPYEPSDPDET